MANQGMYHNVYNPNGTKLASDGLDCFRTSISFTSISDCFDPAKLSTPSGYIGGVSGRPDGLFYDQVHESDIIDLRNNSKKVDDYTRLINREFNKLVAGTNRGKEGEWKLIKTFVTPTAVSTTTSIDGLGSYLLGVDTTSIREALGYTPSSGSYDYFHNALIYIKDDNGKFIRVAKHQSNTAIATTASLDSDNTASPTRGVFTENTTYEVYVATKSTRTKSNTLLHCNIIGNPTNYPTSWKESGVFGTPLIVAEATSLLPDGVKDTFKLSRKANATPLLCLRSTDNGVTWTSFTPTFSTTTNSITLTDEPSGNLVLVYYQTHTSMAVPVANSEVLEIGDVSFLSSINPQSGAYLLNSLIIKTPTNTISPTTNTGIKLKHSSTFQSKLDNGVLPENQQYSISQTQTAACKVFPYLTRLNGKAYLNLVFKEMKFGSYLAPTVVTAASTTYTQNMTYKINIASCALDGKVIKWVGTTATSAIDWSLYDVSPTGIIYLLSTGVVYANAKLYDGDSWGDSNKFEIVDNVSTTTDDNGQTVLIGQKTVELNVFIGADE